MKKKNLHVKRKELKYYISPIENINLNNVLKKFLIQDKNMVGDGGYFIRSLYFDNLDNGAFHEKIEGIEDREKYRMRIYDLDSNEVKFEIKHKKKSTIIKESAIISRFDAIEVQNGNYDVLLKYKNPILSKIYKKFITEKYLPVCLVDYNRKAYLYDIHKIRITFDENISGNIIDLDLFSKTANMKKLISDKISVLEVKYDHELPTWIKNIIKPKGVVRLAVSKFCLARLNKYDQIN